MPPIFLASFPNSRIKPRSATSVERPTQSVAVKPIGGGTGPLGTTLLAVANLNRTFITIENQHATDSMYYGFDPVEVNAGPGRFPLLKGQAIDDESKTAIYAVSATGNDIPVALLEGEG